MPSRVRGTTNPVTSMRDRMLPPASPAPTLTAVASRHTRCPSCSTSRASPGATVMVGAGWRWVARVVVVGARGGGARRGGWCGGDGARGAAAPRRPPPADSP